MTIFTADVRPRCTFPPTAAIRAAVDANDHRIRPEAVGLGRMERDIESFVIVIALNTLNDHHRAYAHQMPGEIYSGADWAASAARSAASSFKRARSVQVSEVGVSVAHSGQGSPAVR